MRGIIKLKKTNYLPLMVGAGILALGFLAMSAAGAKQSTTGMSTPEEIAPLVEVTKATISDGLYQIAAPGRLQARQQLAIVAEVAGKVSYINNKFVMGGRLETGEIMFRIHDLDYKAELTRAEAALKSAEATLVQAKLANDRNLDLAKQGVVSEATKDTAVASLANAEAGVLQAKAQLIRAAENLERTVVKAPFPALVVNETVSIDTYVAPGQNMGTLIDTRAGELVAGLSPKQAAAVSRMVSVTDGKLTATARPNSGSVGSIELVGHIDQFSPSIDETSRSALVVAVFPDAFNPENTGRIFVNDFMTLNITVTSVEAVWNLPAGTVRKGSFIWAVEDSKLKRLPVKVVSGDQTHTLVTAEADLNHVDILVTLLSEETEGFRVRATHKHAIAKVNQE